ncbi:sulfatase-like hydrolase/transferase [Pontiella sulfatireligans]|uniref:Arylsulfatase n=1 Tax=Pontiella sulfatireligans TaxID=2750658 RepID=A0A6C2UEE9_9BACT|nr:sulfatase-like hydrolase/transferase [Pontiella sulfatireligans]SPS74197.1 sulfatase S1_17 [Kiritimatiellales bacterium]VGO18592.1 Arylsulfatase [Pontiella sulfatireligans]
MYVQMISGLLLLSATISMAATPKSLEGSRPNIILVVTDDNSFDTVGRYGGGAVSPNLDKLYDEGLRLNRFHVSPTCSPSRTAMFTGRHEFYAGVTHTIFGRDRLNPECRTIPEVLRDAGYRTGMFGKWHLGNEKKYRPYQRGFDEAWQHGGGGIGQSYANCSDFPANTYHNPMLLHNEEIVQEEGYCTDIFFDKAMQWIKNVKGRKPFFAYITTNTSHGPHIPPLGYDKRFPGADAYTLMQANIDDNMGRLVAFLEKQNLRENTLLIFHTDNGRGGQEVHGIKLKAGKGRAREGGVWVPCIVSWPGTLGNNEDRGQLCGHIDWYMTFSDLAGAKEKAPGTKAWDGRSLLPLFYNTAPADWDNRLFLAHRARWKNGKREAAKYEECSIQNGSYKLFNNEILFDMQSDRGENTDIAAQHPEVVSNLRKQFDAFWADSVPYMINDVNPLENGLLEDEEFHKLYKVKFGEKAYQERLAMMKGWGKGGQTDADFEAWKSAQKN